MNRTRKIKILFDAGPLVNGSMSGVGKYTQGLIESLASNYPDSLEFVGHYFDFLNRKNPSTLPKAPNIKYRKSTILPGKLFTLLRRMGVWIPFEFLVKERGDFHLFPAFIGWPSLFKTPSAPVIHDLTYLDYPEYVNSKAGSALTKLVPNSLSRASFIITVSESSLAGIQKVYALGDKKTLVTPIPPVGLAVIDVSRANILVEDLGVNTPYILFFGTIEPRKNLVTLLSAYELLSEELRAKFALVLAGGQGWNDDKILEKISTLKLSGYKIVQTGYVSDDQRAALYMKASLFILPSFYEGFGMPLLEAMFYQTPVIASKISALEEVAGNAALYCDPTSAADIADKLNKLLANNALQQELIDLGNERLKDFDWRSVAKGVYEQIVAVIK